MLEWRTTNFLQMQCKNQGCCFGLFNQILKPGYTVSKAQLVSLLWEKEKTLWPWEPVNDLTNTYSCTHEHTHTLSALKHRLIPQLTPCLRCMNTHCISLEVRQKSKDLPRKVKGIQYLEAAEVEGGWGWDEGPEEWRMKEREIFMGDRESDTRPDEKRWRGGNWWGAGG